MILLEKVAIFLLFICLAFAGFNVYSRINSEQESLYFYSALVFEKNHNDIDFISTGQFCMKKKNACFATAKKIIVEMVDKNRDKDIVLVSLSKIAD